MSEQDKLGPQGALDKLLPQIRELIIQARNAAKRTIDTLQVVTNFEIGRRIVEEEQHGAKRAEYGKALLKELSAALNAEFGTGFSRTNLEYMRRFYLVYRERALEKPQTPFGKLDAPSKSQTLSGKSSSLRKTRALQGETESAFTLSWSHYLFLTGIKNPDERSFYEIEATTQGWPLRELRRQFDSGLYERLALSRDQDGVRELAKQGQLVTKPEQIVKDPYVLEFLGLREETRYSERELETAIIDKLEQFLLELGKGFLFEARQKRFTFDEEHFFVDVVSGIAALKDELKPEVMRVVFKDSGFCSLADAQTRATRGTHHAPRAISGGPETQRVGNRTLAKHLRTRRCLRPQKGHSLWHKRRWIQIQPRMRTANE